MKYIDSEKLKTEIRIIQQSLEHKDVYLNQVKKIRTESMIELCKCIIGVIDSLQQDHLPAAGKKGQLEKPKKSCYGCPHCVERKDKNGWHFKGCFGGPYKGKFIGEIDECPLKQEQPEVDLEEEIEKTIRSVFFDLEGIAIIGTSAYANVEDMEYIARYFYELGLKAGREE